MKLSKQARAINLWYILRDYTSPQMEILFS